jgi:hypothetical protein
MRNCSNAQLLISIIMMRHVLGFILGQSSVDRTNVARPTFANRTGNPHFMMVSSPADSTPNATNAALRLPKYQQNVSGRRFSPTRRHTEEWCPDK